MNRCEKQESLSPAIEVPSPAGEGKAPSGLTSPPTGLGPPRLPVPPRELGIPPAQCMFQQQARHWAGWPAREKRRPGTTWSPARTPVLLTFRPPSPAHRPYSIRQPALWHQRQVSFALPSCDAGASGTGSITPAAWHIMQFSLSARSWVVCAAPVVTMTASVA